MHPFNLTAVGKELTSQFPTPDLLARLGPRFVARDHSSFILLWVTEGVPAAFAQVPILYQETRNWLADRFRVPSKNITLTGSARSGYSLKPAVFGQPFSIDSDLDFIAISEPLFESLITEFHNFEEDFEGGGVLPQSEFEASKWRQNLDKVSNNSFRGFIDVWTIPARKRYPRAQGILNTMSLLVRRLKSTPGAPHPKHASLRVYQNWPSLTSQIELNLRHTFTSIASQQSSTAPSTQAAL